MFGCRSVLDLEEGAVFLELGFDLLADVEEIQWRLISIRPIINLLRNLDHHLLVLHERDLYLHKTPEIIASHMITVSIYRMEVLLHRLCWILAPEEFGVEVVRLKSLQQLLAEQIVRLIVPEDVVVIVDDELVVDVLVLDQVDALVPELVRLLGLVEVAAVFEGCLMRLVHVGEELLLMVLIVLIPLVLVGRVGHFVVHVGLAFFQEFVYLFFYAVVLMFSLSLAFALDFTSIEVSLVPARVLALIRFHVG